MVFHFILIIRKHFLLVFARALAYSNSMILLSEKSDELI